jgi:AbrB family looped-hinge helix DNA binding protein
MRATIDRAGRIVVPKVLREELGLTPGTELDLEAVEGRLVLAPQTPAVRLEEGPHGLRLVPEVVAEPLGSDEVRALIERQRR